MSGVLGIDLGNTKVAVGVVDTDGAVTGRQRADTDSLRHGDGLLPNLLALIRRSVDEAGAPAVSAGVALPGPADRSTLTLLHAIALPELVGVPLADRLGTALTMPIVGDNDANVAALGEACFGAGRGAAVLAYFTVSTGIGGGIVLDGRLFRGATGAAAEFGHQRAEPEGDPCSCGGAGCLETVASGPAIARRARRMLPHFPGSLLSDRDWRAGREWDARLMAAAAREGDALALHLWDEVGEALGIAVASVIDVLDADCVVLGGGVMNAADLLLPPVRQAAAEHTMPGLDREVRIVPAALGDDVGIVGAAALAMQEATPR